MGFFELVEEQHRIGIAADPLGEVPPFLVSHVARRRTDETGNGMPFHVLAHVKTQQGLFRSQQELGERARHLRLAHSGRTQEEEHAAGPLGTLEPGARPADGPRHGGDRLSLTHDALVKHVFDPEQLPALFLLDRAERNPGPVGHHLIHVAPGHERRLAVPRLPASFDERQTLALGVLLVLGEGGALEVVVVERLVLPLADRLDALPDRGELLRVAVVPQLDARSRFVEQVHRLVGQEAIGDVALGLPDRGVDGIRGVADVVVALVALLHALKDLQGLLVARRLDHHSLEAPFQAPVALDMTPEFRRRGGADALDAVPGKRRLQDVGGVQRTLGGSRAHQGVELVHEDDELGRLLKLLDDRLQPLLELAPIFGAGDHQRDIEGHDPPVGEEDRALAGGDPAGEAFHDRGLPDARLADEDGIVLGAAAEDLDHPVQFGPAADEGIERPVGGRLGEIPGELGEERRLASPGSGFPSPVIEGNRFPDRGRPHSLAGQDRGRGGPGLPEHAEQQMLGPDALVVHPVRFFAGVLQHPLGFGGERNPDGGGDGVPQQHVALDVAPHPLERDVEAPGDGGGKLPQQPQQEMFRLDRVPAQLRRLMPGEVDGPLGALRISLEH